MRWGRQFGFAAVALLASGLLEQGPAVAQSTMDLPEIVVTPPTRREPRRVVAPTAEIVVTPTGRPEPVSRTVGTTQIIDRDTIEHSAAKSVTDLLAENAVGFLSEWSPGQTSINIRGAATEGQGRDFRSQVLVLVNGHRAGTANVSKLSLADVERIEIVRGPASVVYGSQNMGGVINIITKTGRTAPGGFVDGNAGSWGTKQGKAQYGGMTGMFDYYLGVSGGVRDDFKIGGGKREENTAWNRRGILGAVGAQLDANNRVDLNVRSDGIYDAGFRGSSSNVFAFDDRFNQSYELNYNGKLPDGRVRWFFQHYGVNDIDNINNPGVLTQAVTPRTSLDRNIRNVKIEGTRFQPRADLWHGNELLLGWDWEKSWIRSTRNRAGLPGAAAVAQLSPTDNNQTESVNAYYFEDSQAIGDRLIVRGGVRRTLGTTTLEQTPFVNLLTNSKDYSATTYSVGSRVQITDWLAGRVGTSTGFRAPTATELGANFTTATTGNVTFGNPAVRPEQSRQIEAGATFSAYGWYFDAAVFENKIADRITTQVLSVVNSVTTSLTINNPADIVIRGAELQWRGDMTRLVPAPVAHWNWSVFGNGYYDFHMVDKGAPAAATTSKATRINQYEASIGTRFGQAGTGEWWRDWSFQILGIRRGPMWYNTEERLLAAFFPGQVPNVTVYRKDAFWVWNLRGEIKMTENVTFYATINNVFDINQHPIFIALDQIPCVADPRFQNGACGNSMPGREFLVGVQARW